MVIKITTAEEANMEIKSGNLVIVDFFATWCGPCQLYLPIFKETGEHLEELLITIDIDKNRKFVEANNVSSVPTTIAFKDGKEVDRFMGFAPKRQLLEFISKNK